MPKTTLIDRTRISAFAIAVGLLFTFSCEKVEVVRSNPLDPGNPDYIAPEITLTSCPADGAVVDTYAVTFEWGGNNLTVDYRYKTDTLQWTDWSAVTSATVDYLDEGEYSFSVQSRYESGDTSNVERISYVVNAVQGPALTFFPRRHIASLGDTVAFQVLAEEVLTLTAAEFSINFDPEFLEVVSINQGSMFQDQGQSIFLYDVNNQSGSIIVSTALLGGENPSTNGTGDLILLDFIVKKEGATIVDFARNPVFKDPDNHILDPLEVGQC